MPNRTWTGGASDGDWENTVNWDGGVVPINGDDVFFEYTDKDVTLNLDQSLVTLDSLNFASSYRGLVGFENTFLQIGATILNVGDHLGSGSPVGSTRLNIDLGTPVSTVTVFKTATVAQDDFRSPLRLKAVNVGTMIFIRDGKVSIADDPDDASTVSMIDVKGGDTKVGTSVLMNSLLSKAGKITSNSGVNNGVTPAIQIDGGAVTIDTLDATTEINVEGSGSVNVKKTGVITALNAKGGESEFRESTTQRVVTTLTLFADDARVSYDPANLTVGTLQTDSGKPIVIQTSIG